ncbi:MAG: type II toxin-antitoxin system mRNA interferase toxin, RelE/StbE family [Sulfurimonas sp.]|nr:MAG: type II toxin-antitoxin system mRNA interferase toxin, RelE/StbE family [Sulfurimonas sp.]
MALYNIEWKTSAKKELRKIEKKQIKKIIEAVESLASNPHPPNHKKILGTDYNFRIRVGNYRIIYYLENDKLLIEIIRVRHRKDAYTTP